MLDAFPLRPTTTGVVENEIAMLESQAPESQVPESHIQSSPDVEEHNAEFEAMFKKLDNSKKWFLSTGKCVDNKLFTRTTRNMDRHQTEAWYQYHIWSMIESCFDKVKGIEAVTGESASLGSKRRMNQNRTPTTINNMSRLAYGHKCDLVFRQYNNGHNLPLEFGGSVAKPRIEEDYGTNFMEEGFIKLSRMLKDMMDALLKAIDYDNRSTAIHTVGILDSGLSYTMCGIYSF